MKNQAAASEFLVPLKCPAGSQVYLYIDKCMAHYTASFIDQCFMQHYCYQTSKRMIYYTSFYMYKHFMLLRTILGPAAFDPTSIINVVC